MIYELGKLSLLFNEESCDEQWQEFEQLNQSQLTLNNLERLNQSISSSTGSSISDEMSCFDRESSVFDSEECKSEYSFAQSQITGNGDNEFDNQDLESYY